MSAMRHPSTFTRGRQRGAALLIAMVIVTLVATLTASMVWQQWRSVQVESAERVRTQALWILSGAQDWARLILKEDARNGGADHLGEAWATPLAEARLSTFLAADTNNTDDAPDAFLSGKIDDATARYNLRNLVDVGGAINPKELLVLRRLCEFAGVSNTASDALAQSYRLAWLAGLADNSQALVQLGGAAGLAQAPLMPPTGEQLDWLGLDANSQMLLKPYLTILPEPTGVNANTASKEVLAAVVEGMDLATAERLVRQRQRSPFTDPADIVKALSPIPFNVGRLRVTSDYFEVRGRLRIEETVVEQRQLVQRVGADVLVRRQSRGATAGSSLR